MDDARGTTSGGSDLEQAFDELGPDWTGTPLAGGRLLIWDPDSYVEILKPLMPSVSLAEYRDITDAQALRPLIRLYYQLLSMSSVIVGEPPSIESLKEAQKELFAAAAALTVAHTRQGGLVWPTWCLNYCGELVRILHERFPAVSRTRISVGHEPHIRASVDSEGLLHMSAFVRGLLFTVAAGLYENHMQTLIDAVRTNTSPTSTLSPEELRDMRRRSMRGIARLVLPHMISALTPVDPRHFVPVSVSEPASVAWGSYTATLETQYVLAHEYGHIVLGHMSAQATSDRHVNEVAADRFANMALRRLPEPTTAADILIAREWLIMFHYVERIVGALLQGRQPDAEDLGAMSLRAWQSHDMAYALNRANDISPEQWNLGMTGSGLLEYLGGRLIALGPQWICGLAERLRCAPRDGMGDWWEDIRNHDDSD